VGFLGPGWQILLLCERWGEGSGATGAAGVGSLGAHPAQAGAMAAPCPTFPTSAVALVAPPAALLAGAPGPTNHMAWKWLRRFKNEIFCKSRPLASVKGRSGGMDQGCRGGTRLSGKGTQSPPLSRGVLGERPKKWFWVNHHRPAPRRAAASPRAASCFSPCRGFSLQGASQRGQISVRSVHSTDVRITLKVSRLVLLPGRNC